MVNSIDRSRRIPTHLAVAVTGLAAACGGDGANPRVMAEVDTIGGVVVVRNGTGLWRESERWRVVEEFRVGSLGGKNPDGELRHATNNSVTLGPNGQIFVMEYAADRVMVFSGDGEFVKSFGGSGEGPGELGGPMAMTWDGMDRLWVADRRGRYSVFDSTGTIQKTSEESLVPSCAFSIRSGGRRGAPLSKRPPTMGWCCFFVWIRWGTSLTRWQ